MGSYDKNAMQKDLFQAMQPRPGKYSGRALGNADNIKLWTPQKVDSLWEGIVTAHARIFKKECPSLKEFARLIICEGMQESSGNWNLGCKPVDFSDHTSHGFIQVTPGSVMIDFYNWGLPVKSALTGRTGVVLLDPAKTLQMDTSDPCTTVMMFAWYSKNSVNMGVSFNEYAHRKAWNIPIPTHNKVYGSLQLTWLAGPRMYVDTPEGQAAYDDYYKRILDYYTQSQFGTKEQFDQHVLQTKLVNELLYVKQEVITGTAK